MIINTEKDITEFIKLLNNKNIFDTTKIRYYSNFDILNIEKINKNLLKLIKVKYLEFKKILKILGNELKLLDFTMIDESGFNINPTDNNYNNNRKIKDYSESFRILFEYQNKISVLQKKITNICHTITLCYSIIFMVWKKYYSPFVNICVENEHVHLLSFPKLLVNSIGYNIFYNNL